MENSGEIFSNHGASEENIQDPEQGINRTSSFFRLHQLPNRNHLVLTPIQTLLLSYQSLGVVYGDLGTSPLYVFTSIVSLPNLEERDILGVLSLIFWTLTVIALVKYVFIVLRADDHGEGGTFALYSLLRQHVRFQSKVIAPTTTVGTDSEPRFDSRSRGLESKTRRFLEESKRAQSFVTFIVLLGTCMVIGDGALTPAVSVLSAVQGIQSRSSKITQEHVVLLSVLILVVLFLFQRFGTAKVSITFSPIMLLWFTSTAAIGVYNILKFYPSVLKAVSPHYIYIFFSRNHKAGWEALGAVFLCITGAEAMFADLGHFSMRAIQIAYSTVVYPALILAYAGQGAFLIKNPDKLSTAFYSSVPQALFWPMFVVSTMAAIVASQALISASFSIIRQSVALGCFPRVTIKHTSRKHEGQVYAPEVNYLLMIICILLVVGFKGGVAITNAFGVAVVWVMLITTFLMAIVMLTVWNTNLILVGIFLVFFIGIEGTYMTSLLNKLAEGAWVPFAISALFLVITLSWTYGRSKKSQFEAERKMSLEELNTLISNNNISRVPGICFFCTDLAYGIPPIVRHYVQHIGTLRQVMAMVTVRTLPVNSVPEEEQFVIAKLGPKGVYRCLVQYGYMDEPNIGSEAYLRSILVALSEHAQGHEETQMLASAANSGVIFVFGRILLKASEKEGWFKQLVVNNLYRFLQKNFRSTVTALKIPPGKVLQVGMVYEV